MKKICTTVAATLILLAVSLSVQAQSSILNPNDPIVTYDPNNPPATPPWGPVAKWVRTADFYWSVPQYKCYYYKGMAFRLLYPKSYNPTANDGKTYPMVVFFHGLGERGTIYDNELSLRWEGLNFWAAESNGSFDGYVMYPQNTGGYFTTQNLQNIHELIQYMAQNNKLDNNRVSFSGLSGGGQSDWVYMETYPTDVASANIISAAFTSLINYVNSTFKYIPTWLAQGGLDDNPAPSTSQTIVDSLKALGAPITYTVYPNYGHGVWDLQYAQPDTYPFFLRANKTNPVVFFGKTQFCPSDTATINVTLGLSPGFSGYEWRRNGVVIPGAVSNTLQVTALGTYDAHIKRDTTWSYWSPVPVVISVKQPTQTPNIKVSGLMSSVIPAPDGNTSVTRALPSGYASYLWQKADSPTILSTQQTFAAAQTGNYIAKVTEFGGCSSNYSAPFYVASTSGPNPPDPAFNLTGFASSQTQITLHWNDKPTPLHNETGFEIYRGTVSGGPYKLVFINPADSLTYLDNGVIANTKYYYIVRAIDSTAAAASTPELSVLTLVDKIPPTAPGNLQVTGSTQTSVSLKWNAATDNVSVAKYIIYINGARSYVTTDTSFTVYNLTHGQVYNIVVKAVDPSGNISTPSNQVATAPVLNGLNYYYYTGSWSNLPDFSTLTPVSTGVTNNVSLSPATQTTNFAFMWQGYIKISVSGTYTFGTYSDDGSKLYIGAQGAQPSYNPNATPLVNNDGLHAMTFQSNNITLNAGYYPIVITYFQQGGSSGMQVMWQSTALGMTNRTLIPDSVFKEQFIMPGNPPAAPSNVAATAASFSQINVTWTDNSNNETGFEVYRATNPSQFTIIATTGPGITAYQDSTLNPQTTYYYKVQAINQYGSSGFNPAGSATTLAPPPPPAAPTNLAATAVSPYQINLLWNNNSTNATGFTIYRSVGNNAAYQPFVTIGPNSGTQIAYKDSALNANTAYYYKVQANGTGGASAFTNEATATTLDNPPVLGIIGNFTMRYDSTLYVDISAFDPDNEKLTFSCTNLPSFGTFIDYGDGTGLITFKPVSVNQGVYPNIQVSVQDQHGGSATQTFTLTVNNIYPIAINPIPAFSLKPDSTLIDTLTVYDRNTGDTLTWSAIGLPSFASLTPLPTGQAVLTLHPSYTDAGNYSMQINVNNGKGASDSKSVSVSVAFINTTINWYVNFSYKTTAGLPWNNVTGVTTNNLVNDKGTTTTVGLAMQTSWWAAYNTGAVTGNNSGIYPDNVIRDYYYFGSAAGGPNSVNAKVTGLDVNKKYNFTFFASNNWNYTADNGNTIFSIGNQTDSIHVQNNTQKTVTFSNIIPASDGSVTFTMLKGSNAIIGCINAMVISTNNAPPSPPAKPLNFAVANLAGGNVQLTWTNPLYNNAQGHEVYRATAKAGPYTLLNPNPANGTATTYIDSTSLGHPLYYYTMRAVNLFGNSAFTDTLNTNTITLPDIPVKWYINFSYQTTAGLPWNNVTGVTTNNLANDKGTTTTVGLAMQTNWWAAYNTGAVTGNNSGIYPDNVIRDYYYFGSTAGGPNSVNAKVTGLDVNKKYNFTFFASNNWNYTADNGNTIFSIGNQTDSIHVQNNTQKTVIFSNIIPASDGSVTFTMLKGSNAVIGCINAMVIASVVDSTIPPATPLNFAATNLTGGNVKLSWSNPQYTNAQGNAVYRAITRSGPYTLLNPNPVNGTDTTYTDSTAAGRTTYYYVMRAITKYASSPSTDTLNITTLTKNPVFVPISNVIMKYGSTDTVNISATGGPGDMLTLSAGSLPSYASFQDLGNGQGRVILKPVSTDLGNNSTVAITAVTNNGGNTTTSFNITVKDKYLSYIYINFTGTLTQVIPWNNLTSWGAGNAVNNLIDENNIPTGGSISLVNSWAGAGGALQGMTTYNNSGIYPDNVLQTYFYVTDTVTRQIKVSGLSAGQKYNFVFYSGSYYYNFNYNTSYRIGNQTVTLNGTRNISKTVQINGVSPDTNGNVIIFVQKPPAADMALINALVIQAYSDTTHVIPPGNLQATAVSNNAINLTWADNSFNETGFTLWRATTLNGTYSNIATLPAGTTSYTNNSLSANTRYFYKMQATGKNNNNSDFSNIASATTLQFAVYVNFNAREAGAPLPWNNTNRFPSDGDSFSNLIDNNNNNTGIGFTMVKNFEGENNVGVVTGNNSGVFPDLVMQGEYYLDNGLDTVVMKVTGLNISTKYNFVFFGSVVGFGWSSVSQFLINNQMVSLATTNNSTQTVQINDVSPDNNGVVTIRIINATGTSYAILGAMVIQAHTNYDNNGNPIYFTQPRLVSSALGPQNNKPGTGNNEIKAYPNPFSNQIRLELNYEEADGQVTLQLYDIRGRLISEKYLGNLSKGSNNIIFDVSGRKLTNGVYLLKVTSGNGKPPKVIQLIRLQ